MSDSDTPELEGGMDGVLEGAEKSAPEDRATEGPLDESEANPVRPYVDLGGVKILPREGLHLRLEVEEESQRVVAVGLDYANSTSQVQPFAAPRSSGLWNEIREQIADQVQRQGGRVTERDGVFGPELVAEIPVAAPQGAPGETRVARFVGVDGEPRQIVTEATPFVLVDHDLFRVIPLEERSARIVYDTRGIWPEATEPAHSLKLRLAS